MASLHYQLLQGRQLYLKYKPVSARGSPATESACKLTLDRCLAVWTLPIQHCLECRMRVLELIPVCDQGFQLHLAQRNHVQSKVVYPGSVPGGDPSGESVALVISGRPKTYRQEPLILISRVVTLCTLYRGGPVSVVLIPPDNFVLHAFENAGG